MRAVQISSHDGPDALRIGDVAEPQAREGEILIEVEFSAVGFPELLLSEGKYQLDPKLPFVPGSEAVGTVLESGAPAFKPGRRVLAFPTLGALAERLSVPASMVLPLPEEVPSDQAVALLINYQTALFALSRRGGMQSGETVLVHGGSGGVGSAAVQVAKALGGRVMATCSSDEKRDVALRLGADTTIDLGGEWRKEILGLTDGAGVDLVFDPVGGSRTGESVRCLAEGGRLLVIGFAAGEIPRLAANRLLLGNSGALGVFWGGALKRRPDLLAELHGELLEMFSAGRIEPLIGAEYPLEGVGTALVRLSARGALGKLVVRVGEPA
jgi:NADPH2:quinone reductase